MNPWDILLFVVGLGGLFGLALRWSFEQRRRPPDDDTMREEYDFSDGVRGAYMDEDTRAFMAIAKKGRASMKRYMESLRKKPRA